MTLTAVLGIARSAMNAQQLAIQTAGHNIANVDTSGYSRQSVELTPSSSQHWTYGSVGTGVTIVDVTQARDAALDQQYRTEASGAAASQLRQDLLSNVEGILGEPSDTGLSAAMDAFWSSWSDLAAQPTSGAARSIVQQRGQQVATLLNGFDQRLTDQQSQVSAQLDRSVSRINALSDQIADLNGRIVSAEVDGTTANDLRDQRNNALDELAKLGDTRVIENADGSVQVRLGNNALVDGTTGRHIHSVTTASGTIGLQVDNGSDPMLPVGGTTQVMLDFLDHDVADVRGRLDALASGLVTQVNALHESGTVYNADGTTSTQIDFFDPNKTSARDIALSIPVAASAANIAAAANPLNTPSPGPGNNEVALAMAGLRSAANQVSYTDANGQTQSGSFTGFYQDVAGRIGTQVANAKADADVHSALATQADTRRQSVSGVNLDEELTNLMRAQQAYAAAAKVISTASDMMKTLVDMV